MFDHTLRPGMPGYDCRIVPTIRDTCDGPNRACRVAHRAGRPVHIIPPMVGADAPKLILPTYHYATPQEAMTALEHAMATATTIRTDEDLYAARVTNVAHFLPVGWVDPTRR